MTQQLEALEHDGLYESVLAKETNNSRNLRLCIIGV